MARVEYTREQKEEFIAVAEERGVRPAMRELGYPGSHHTVMKWFSEYGKEMPDVSYLQRKARALKEFYSDREELAVCQMMLEVITEKLETDNLDSDGINKLANSLQRVIQTANLIKGKATNVNESHTKDATDLEISRLVKEMAEKNSEFININGQ